MSASKAFSLSEVYPYQLTVSTTLAEFQQFQF